MDRLTKSDEKAKEI